VKGIQAPEAQRGFTLLEVVVALAILSLCAMLLYEGMHLCLGGWQAAIDQAQREDSILAAQQFIRARLQTISPFRTDPSVSSEIPFAGSAQELEFTAPAPAAMGFGELRYVLRLHRTRTDGALVVRWRRTWNARIDRVAGDAWHEEPLIADVSNLEFQYFDTNAPEGSKWRASWDERSVPQLIRVIVKFATNDSRKWPRLVIKREIEADPQCEFDPVSQTCRDI
jgi:general secretion pathway protein J